MKAYVVIQNNWFDLMKEFKGGKLIKCMRDKKEWNLFFFEKISELIWLLNSLENFLIVFQIKILFLFHLEQNDFYFKKTRNIHSWENLRLYQKGSKREEAFENFPSSETNNRRWKNTNSSFRVENQERDFAGISGDIFWDLNDLEFSRIIQL